MKRKPYPSDLSDAQWALLEPLMPKAKQSGRPRRVELRQIINRIFYILCGGCTWHMMPHDPAWKTVITLVVDSRANSGDCLCGIDD